MVTWPKLHPTSVNESPPRLMAASVGAAESAAIIASFFCHNCISLKEHSNG